MSDFQNENASRSPETELAGTPSMDPIPPDSPSSLEDADLPLPVLNAKERKEAGRELKRAQRTADSRLRKWREQVRLRSFFAQNFIGKQIAKFVAKRCQRRAEALAQSQKWSAAEHELHQALRWVPDQAHCWFRLAEIAMFGQHPGKALRDVSCALLLEPSNPDFLRLQARIFGELKQFSAALTDWRKVMILEPQNSVVFFNVGVIYGQRCQFQRAQLFLKRAVELDSSNAIYELTLAKVCFQTRNFTEAELHYRTAKALFLLDLANQFPEMAENTNLRGKFLEKRFREEPFFKKCYLGVLAGIALTTSILKKPEETLKVSQELLTLEPGNLEARLLNGTAEYDSLHLPKALEIFEEIIKTNPEIGLPYWYCGDILWHFDRLEEALPNLLMAVEKQTHLREAVKGVIYCLQSLEKNDELKQFCSKMISQGRKWFEVYHARGVAEFSMQQLEEAIQDLKAALKLNPRQESVWKDLAFIFYSAERYEETLHAAAQALKLNSDALEVGVLKTAALKALNRTDEALTETARILKKDPQNCDALILKAQLLRSKGELESARQTFSEALKKSPNHPIALSGRAAVLAEMGDFARALPDCSAAISAEPSMLRLYVQRALYCIQLKKFENALADCKFVLERNPRFPDVWLTRGEINLAMGKPEAAILDFQRAFGLNPQNVIPLIRSAEAKASLGLLKPALEDVEKALKIRPDETELEMQKVVLLTMLKQVEPALEYCSGILARNPDKLQIRFQRGSIFMNLQQFEDALADFEFVTKNDPNAMEPHFAKALVLNGLFRHEEALTELNRVLEIHPDFIPALSEKAMTYSTLGNAVHSMKLMEKILELDPKNVRILNFRGTVLANTKFHREAIEDFEKAVEIQPNYAPAHNNLGHMLALAGELMKGLEHLNTTLELSPDWPRPYLNRAAVFMKMRRIDDAENDIQTAMNLAKKVGDEDTLVDAIALKRKNAYLRRFMANDDEDDEDSVTYREWDGSNDDDSWDGEDPDDENDSNDEIISDDSDGDEFWDEFNEFEDEDELNGDEDEEPDEESDEDADFLNQLFQFDDSENNEFLPDDEEDEDLEDFEAFDDDFDDDYDSEDEDEDEFMNQTDEEDPKNVPHDPDFKNTTFELTTGFLEFENFIENEKRSKEQKDLGKNLWPQFKAKEEESLEGQEPLRFLENSQPEENRPENGSGEGMDAPSAPDSNAKKSLKENLEVFGLNPQNSEFLTNKIWEKWQKILDSNTFQEDEEYAGDHSEDARSENPPESETDPQETRQNSKKMHQMLSELLQILEDARQDAASNPASQTADENDEPLRKPPLSDETDPLNPISQPDEMKGPCLLVRLQIEKEPNPNTDVLMEMDPSTPYACYSESHEKFFEELTRVSDALNQLARTADSASEKRKIRKRKKQLEELMEIVTENLMTNEPDDMLLLFADLEPDLLTSPFITITETTPWIPYQKPEESSQDESDENPKSDENGPNA